MHSRSQSRRGCSAQDSAARVYAESAHLHSAQQSGAAYPVRVSGTLFIVATPIGNLEDITLRALRVLRECDLIAAESPPVAAKLLRRHEISTPTAPYNDRNRERTTPQLLDRLAAGESVALISDAGTPGVSDPGRALVAAAVEAGINVIPIPGAATPIALWSAAGIAGADVRFAGFLPKRQVERVRFFAAVADSQLPTIVFESPHRVGAALGDLAQALPDARLVIGRELTKLHEQIWRGRAADAPAAFPRPRGEFAILIVPPEPVAEWGDAEIAAALAAAAAGGASRSEAAKAVAREAGRPRSEVYALWPR